MAKSSIEYVYGINPSFEVVRGKKRKIYKAYLGEKSANNPRIKKLVEFLTKNEIPIEWTNRERLNQLSGTTDNQGAVIRTSVYKYDSLEDVAGAQKILLFDNVEDPHNVGAIIRSAEIFGFHTILMPLKGVPEVYPSVIKVSAGASEHVKIVRESNSNSYVRKLQEDHGYQVIALDEKGTISIKEAVEKVKSPVLLVIGGEDKSVGQFILNRADMVVSIEQFGKINSLNASVAASIAMFVLGGKNAS
ncbi:MAG TPA: 23S rRNA (guanosine(2251)-2'-O)-methyltransferase RlmB [bacterium]|nr:23S rRNA (guanosine(2251)-2'-O)-methyltransferase RlmB [bacterium]